MKVKPKNIYLLSGYHRYYTYDLSCLTLIQIIIIYMKVLLILSGDLINETKFLPRVGILFHFVDDSDLD